MLHTYLANLNKVKKMSLCLLSCALKLNVGSLGLYVIFICFTDG